MENFIPLSMQGLCFNARWKFRPVKLQNAMGLCLRTCCLWRRHKLRKLRSMLRFDRWNLDIRVETGILARLRLSLRSRKMLNSAGSMLRVDRVGIRDHPLFQSDFQEEFLCLESFLS